MATIIDNRTPEVVRPTIVDSADSSVGWAVAVIILLAIIAVGAFWYMRYRAPAAQTNNPGPSIQVNVPNYTQPANNTQTQAPANTPTQ